MKVKLDENMPVDADAVVAAFGHDSHTVVGEGLQGADDDTVVAAALSEERILITLDRRLADFRIRPPGSHPGIIVLRTSGQDPPTVVRALQTFLENQDLDDVAGCVVVVRGHLIRIRRPGD